MTTSQLSKRDSLTTHGEETSGRDRYKGTLTRKVSADKHSMTDSGLRKPSSTISQISTSRHHSQPPDSGLDKLDEMGSSRGSREGIVFDDTFEGMTLKIQYLVVL